MPFNKQNCVAMLNTLFPPIASVSPTANPTQDTLQEQRDDFFKKISSVEKSGPQVLSSIHQQGMTEGDANGWAPVARQLGMYLQLTTSMMDECCNMQNVERLVPHKHVFGKGGNSKTDTNVSLSGFDKWPSTSGTGVTFPTEPCRPKTSSGARGTQLGKLARGLETFGRSRTKVADLSPEDEMFAIPHQKQHKAVKKIRSIGKLSLKF